MIDRLFSNLFENDTDQLFLFGNLDKLPRSIALFLLQNFKSKHYVLN